MQFTVTSGQRVPFEARLKNIESTIISALHSAQKQQDLIDLQVVLEQEAKRLAAWVHNGMAARCFLCLSVEGKNKALEDYL